MRRADWPERLAALLDARMHVPFSWGSQDCITLAADVALALTGRDPIAQWRGTYSTEAEADAILAGKTIEEFAGEVMQAFGGREVPVALAQRGDWCIVTLGNHSLVGVVIGSRAVAPALPGLGFVPMRRASRAWAY